jgi:mannose-6-phosphate isomerase-like protein (cupin superfamily)/quinol monooxygenase YgiN
MDMDMNNDKIARHVRFRATAGRGDELAGALAAVADGLRSVPACELYFVTQEAADRDVVWVTELWSGAEAMTAALQAEGGEAQIARVRALTDGAPELIELAPAGAAGLVDATAAPAHTRVALADVPDSAGPGGFGEMGEARFANDALGTRATGVSVQRLNPGVRQPFGHRHHRAEEVYVVLAGAGRVKLDDETVDLATGDALRVAPGVARAFEAGPEGLELLACGPRHRGDGEILMGWWGG